MTCKGDATDLSCFSESQVAALGVGSKGIPLSIVIDLHDSYLQVQLMAVEGRAASDLSLQAATVWSNLYGMPRATFARLDAGQLVLDREIERERASMQEHAVETLRKYYLWL